MEKHTPTFTKIECYGAAGGSEKLGSITAHIEAANCETVASVKNMIAAAPELLEALIKAESWLHAATAPQLLGAPRYLVEGLKDIRTAIAKARGETEQGAAA